VHAFFQGTFDEYFEKGVFRKPLAGEFPVSGVRGDEGRDDYYSGISEEFRHFHYSPEVFPAMLPLKIQVGIEAMAYIVPVQHVGVYAAFKEFLFHGMGQGGFSGPGQAGKPKDRTGMTIQPGPIRPGDKTVVPD